MNTIILFWNPEISSYTIERLRDDLHSCTHVNNWSVWEHEKAHQGDRFFMVRCGEGKTGICMSGRFSSEPYMDDDWSGKGREVYSYVAVHPDNKVYYSKGGILYIRATGKEVLGRAGRSEKEQ